MFIAITSAEVREEDLQVLTPVVMKWRSDTFWVLDLNSCQRYWQQQAKRSGLKLTDFYRKVLQETFGQKPFIASMGQSPWQAILLLTHMQERGLNGVMNYSDALGYSLYKDISWNSFWLVAGEFGDFGLLIKWKRFNLRRFAGSASRCSAQWSGWPSLILGRCMP